MKRLSKAIVLLLSAIMVLAMSTSVFAADPPTSGNITVNPNFNGQEYKLYNLFDAHITFNDDGTQRAITYTLPAGKSLDDDNKWFELNENGFVVPKTGVTDQWAKDPDAIAWAKSFGTQQGSAITAASDNDPNVKWENVPFGYYFVESSMGSFIGVDSDNPNVTIQDKNVAPTIDKEITGVNDSTATLGIGDENKRTDPGKGESEKAIAQIGDTVGFKLTVAAKPGAKSYVVTDTLPAGLTAPAANAVNVSCTPTAITADDYTVAVSGQVITVTFEQSFLDKITAEASIVITYDAVLNDSAVIGQEGNTNNVKLTWGNKPDINKSEDESTVYTAQVEVLKNDDKEKPLANAGFVVKNSAGKYYKLANGVVTWVDSIDDAEEHNSGADGKVAAFTGLGNGPYTLVEKTVPAGYNKLADTQFTVAPKDYTDTNLKQSKTVVNNTGTELPSTGGIGTVIFYVLGSALLIGCGIVLISRKRMQK